jgi:hypothetical protein
MTQACLESGYFGIYAPARIPNRVQATSITKLILRLGRTDWWAWRSTPDDSQEGEALALDPSVGDGEHANHPTLDRMRELTAARREGRIKDVPDRGWGEAISRMFPELKVLEMVFGRSKRRPSRWRRWC